MPDLATVNKIMNLGVETTPGTGVAAGKRFTGANITLAHRQNTKRVRPAGYLVDTAVLTGRRWTEGKLAGAMNFNELPYFLSSFLKTVTPVQIIATTGLAYRWTYKPSSVDGEASKYFTIENGSSDRAKKAAGHRLKALGFQWNQDDISLDGESFGLEMQRGITLTATPAEIPLVPAQATKLDVFIDGASAFGTTKQLRIFGGSLKLGNRANPFFTTNSALNSYAGSVLTALDATAQLTIGADAAGEAFIGDLEGGNPLAKTRFEVKDVNIDPAANPFRFTVDLPMKWEVVGESKDEQGVDAFDLTGRLVHDSAFAGWIEAVVVCATSAL